jgi:small subunit ribosomal protein S4
MKYTGPKDRLSRRTGVDLFGKGAKLTRLTVLPGQHGQKGQRKLSEYGRQLKEKQKARYVYGISEKQMRGYMNQAQKDRGNTGEALVKLLERRLDNVVYRLGFVPTRSAARQLVSHKHVLVNGKSLNISSYLVKKDDNISLDAKAQDIPEIKKALVRENLTLPSWLQRKAIVGNVKDLPKREEVSEPYSEQDIVEFYSR